MLRFCAIVLSGALFIAASGVMAQDASAPSAAMTPIPAPAKPFVYTPQPSDIVIGKTEAPVTIVEYASLSCPHCAHFFTEVLPQLSTKYIDTGKVKLVYRHFPLNKPALEAAKLVQCAEPDRRHTFLKVLFSTQSKWAFDVNSEQSLGNIGAVGGVTPEQFKACLSDPALEKTILQVTQQAADDYKVSSTPTFFINGQLETGDHGFETMSASIDKALAASKK